MATTATVDNAQCTTGEDPTAAAAQLPAALFESYPLSEAPNIFRVLGFGSISLNPKPLREAPDLKPEGPATDAIPVGPNREAPHLCPPTLNPCVSLSTVSSRKPPRAGELAHISRWCGAWQERVCLGLMRSYAFSRDACREPGFRATRV